MIVRTRWSPQSPILCPSQRKENAMVKSHSKPRLIHTAAFMAVCVAVTAFVAPAGAAVVRIDFGHETQETAATGWNNVSGPNSAKPTGPFDLDNAAGTDSGIDLALTYTATSNQGISGTAANYNGPYPAEVSAFPTSANQDSLFTREGETITLTFSGLVDTKVYNLLIYGAAGNTGNQSDFTINGVTKSITATVNNASEVVEFDAVAPSSQTITLVFSGSGGGENQGRLNVIQIAEAIPAPAALPAGLVMLGVAAARRRRVH